MSKPFWVDRYGDSKADIPADVLKPVDIEDKRPFFVRLAQSIRWKLGRDRKTGKMTFEAHGGADF